MHVFQPACPVLCFLDSREYPISSYFLFQTDSLVYSVVIPILPLFVTSTLHLDEQDVGFLFASYAGGLLVATPLFGLASDRFGRRAPMLFGLLGLAAATMGFAFAQSYWQLVLARVAQGVSGAASFVVGLAMISDAFPVDEVGGALGLVMGVNAIGFLVGPTIGGVMYERLGFRAPFFLCAALAVADFVARFALVSDEALLAMHAQSMRDSASLSSSSSSSSSSAFDAGGADAGTLESHSVILAASDGSGGTVRVPVSSSSSSRLGSPIAPQKTVSYGSFAQTADNDGSTGTSLRTLSLMDLLRDRGVQIIFYCNTAIAMFFVGLEPIWALHLQVWKHAG
jgi:multidrug resistance protein